MLADEHDRTGNRFVGFCVLRVIGEHDQNILTKNAADRLKEIFSQGRVSPFAIKGRLIKLVYPMPFLLGQTAAHSLFESNAGIADMATFATNGLATF